MAFDLHMPEESTPEEIYDALIERVSTLTRAQEAHYLPKALAFVW